jgi:hypothetical protein
VLIYLDLKYYDCRFLNVPGSAKPDVVLLGNSEDMRALKRATANLRSCRPKNCYTPLPRMIIPGEAGGRQG